MTNNLANEAHDTRARLLTINEASQSLRLSRWSIYQLINSRRIKTVKVSGRRLITPDDLDAFVAGLHADDEYWEHTSTDPAPTAQARANPEGN